MLKDNLLEFIKGFSGAVELHRRANNKGSFIESVCLGASIIDGVLRIGIILKHQIDTKSNEQIRELLQQEKDDKIITERQVYKMALDSGIIDEIIFNNLEKLYKDRNRVVHRYIISEITTDEVLKIAIEYDNTIKVVNKKIEELEKKQIEMGVGMTVYNEDIDIQKWIEDLGKEKHGNDELAIKLRDK
jgi:hypothetical protein